MADQASKGALSYGLGEYVERRAPMDPELVAPDNVPLSLAQTLQPRVLSFPSGTVESTTPTPQPFVARVVRTEQAPANWRSLTAGLLKILLGLLLLRAVWRWRAMWRGLQQRHHAGAITTARWPALSIVLPPGHPVEAVARRMQALLHSGYPADSLFFLPLSSSMAPITHADIAPYLALPTERIVPVSVSGPLHNCLDAMRVAFVHAPTDLMLVIDFDRPLPPDTLKQAVSPFLDPAVGAIQGTGHGRTPTTLSCLLDLARQVQTTPCDPGSHTRLLPGATVMGVRRSAWLSCGAPQEEVSPAEVEFVARLSRHGWHTAMQGALGDRHGNPQRWTDYLRRVRTASLTAPHATRLPVRLRPDPARWISLLWLSSLLLSVLAYFAGNPVLASIGMLICSFNSFDASGQATSLLSALIPARARRPSPHLSLLPLMPLLHLLAAVQPLLAWLGHLLPPNSRARRRVLAHTAQRQAA